MGAGGRSVSGAGAGGAVFVSAAGALLDVGALDGGTGPMSAFVSGAATAGVGRGRGAMAGSAAVRTRLST